MIGIYFRTRKKVQHCNSRSEYKMIKHEFDPVACVDCWDLIAVLSDDFVTFNTPNKIIGFATAEPDMINTENSLTGYSSQRPGN